MPKKCLICCAVLTNKNCRNYANIDLCLNCEANVDATYNKPKKKRGKK